MEMLAARQDYKGKGKLYIHPTMATSKETEDVPDDSEKIQNLFKTMEF